MRDPLNSKEEIPVGCDFLNDSWWNSKHPYDIWQIFDEAGELIRNFGTEAEAQKYVAERPEAIWRKKRIDY